MEVENRQGTSNNNDGENLNEPDWLRQYFNRQGDWLEKTRGNLMVTATVIATMSFQMMINPPGGVWQDDKCNVISGGGDWAGSPVSNPVQVCTKEAGTSVLEYSDSKREAYVGAVISCTVSFSASMSIILLAISGLHLRNRVLMVLLIGLMLTAVVCMVFAYGISVALVQSDDKTVIMILTAYRNYWILFPALIVMTQLLRFAVWLLRLAFCCKPKRSRTRSYGHLTS